MNLLVPQDKGDLMDHQERNHPIDHQYMKVTIVPHPTFQKGPHIAQPWAHLALTSLLQKKPKPNPKFSLPAHSPQRRVVPPTHSKGPSVWEGRALRALWLVPMGLRAHW